jgi:hypothetical protein
MRTSSSGARAKNLLPRETEKAQTKDYSALTPSAGETLGTRDCAVPTMAKDREEKTFVRSEDEHLTARGQTTVKAI